MYILQAHSSFCSGLTLYPPRRIVPAVQAGLRALMARPRLTGQTVYVPETAHSMCIGMLAQRPAGACPRIAHGTGRHGTCFSSLHRRHRDKPACTITREDRYDRDRFFQVEPHRCVICSVRGIARGFRIRRASRGRFHSARSGRIGKRHHDVGHRRIDCAADRRPKLAPR